MLHNNPTPKTAKISSLRFFTILLLVFSFALAFIPQESAAKENSREEEQVEFVSDNDENEVIDTGHDTESETDSADQEAAEEARATEEKKQAELATIKAMQEKVLKVATSQLSLSRDGKTIIWKVQSNAKPAELAQAMTNVLGENAKAVKNLDSFNTVMIETETPSPETLNSVIEFVGQVERPERQVFLKVLIAEMQIEENRNAGNHLQFLDKSIGQAAELAMSVTSNHSPYSTATEESVRAGLKLFLLSGRRFKNFLYAQQTNRGFQVISSPQIVATHGRQAQVVVGQEVNVRTSTTVSDGVASVEYGKIPIGLTLRVIPYIHSNGLISMDITQSISSLDTYDQERNLASTFERLITTTANVPIGQTIVLGGIISRRRENNRASVPLLSRLPLLRKVFDRREKSEQQVELLVFITPEIADSSRQQQKITSETLASVSDNMHFKKEVSRQMSTEDMEPAKDINRYAAEHSDTEVETVTAPASESTTEKPTMAELLRASRARKAKMRKNP